MSFAEFLESVPPNSRVKVRDLSDHTSKFAGNAKADWLASPEIHIHCENERCNGPRFFRGRERNLCRVSTEITYSFVMYVCSNCRRSVRTFALGINTIAEGKPEGEVFKFGELPVFGPPTPSRLVKLIGPDREDFLKGRRCENQGIGVGAFAYYRRVVENQRSRILSEVIRVAEKVGAPQEKMKLLDDALNETQFSKSLALARDAIPESLLINGHSPFALLHSALSEGLHKQSDEECLSIASSVRVVLVELSDRLSQALKDEAELNTAISALLNRTPKD